MSAPAAYDIQNLFQDAMRHHLAGRIENAVSRYKRTLHLKPDHADAHNNLGVALAAQGRLDEAVSRYRRALSLNPESVDAYVNLGAALAAQSHFAESITHCRHALLLNPLHAGAHYNLAIALQATGLSEEAELQYKCAIALDPANADAHNNLGNALAARGENQAAGAHYKSAIGIKPGHAEAHNNLANLLREEGGFDEALAHYDRAIAASPTFAEAHFHRAGLKADTGALLTLAARKDVPVKDVPFIHFALAKALEDTGEYKRAFAHLRRGNAAKRKQIHYDEQAALRRFDEIATVFDRSTFERLQGLGDASTVPVFVLGMPRSGSTLVEQILASHPRVHGAGELTHLVMPESIPALDCATLRKLSQLYLSRLPKVPHARIVDKLPDNFLRVGLICLLFPNAKIIHTVRNPMDTCLSCYSTLFASGQHFSYELGELVRYYQGYGALMAHWHTVLPAHAILDVSYEDVVADLEGQARRLIEYCGLEWDTRCLDFHRTRRAVKTASAVQIRKPLFSHSVDRWRRFEDDLAPLIHSLCISCAQHANMCLTCPP